MQVSFNTIKNNYYTSFSAAKKEEKSFPSAAAPSKDEIITAKTKKAVSECKYIALGVSILYFAMKRNFKVNRIKNLENKAIELAKTKAPTAVLINPDLIKN